MSSCPAEQRARAIKKGIESSVQAQPKVLMVQKPCILPQRCNIKIIGALRISKLKCGEKEFVLRIHNGLLRKNELKRSGKTREEVEYKSCRIKIGSLGVFVLCSGKATNSSGGDQMA